MQVELHLQFLFVVNLLVGEESKQQTLQGAQGSVVTVAEFHSEAGEIQYVFVPH